MKKRNSVRFLSVVMLVLAVSWGTVNIDPGRDERGGGIRKGGHVNGERDPLARP